MVGAAGSGWSVVIAEVYTDDRKMRFDLPADLPKHRTPKGARPIQPEALTITYSRTYPSGRPHICVELFGRKLHNDAKYGRSTVGDGARRTFSTPWSRGRSDDALATFDELGLPEWARPYVELNRPDWCPGGES